VTDLGKILVFVGVLIVAAGVVLLLLGKTNFPLGLLPGDILYRGKNTTFYFPLAMSILVSVVLSAVLYFLGRMRR
jgi:heme/copper-type cytochrome/quinol oxidase subunit 2